MKYPRYLMNVAAATLLTALPLQPVALADAITHYQPSLLKIAERALERGHPGLTLEMLKDRTGGLRAGTARAEGYGLTCRAHFEQGDYARAEQACDLAVREGGAAAWRHLNNRGVMRMMQGRNREALADFQAAQRLAPAEGDVTRNMALVKRALAATALEVSAVAVSR